MKDKTKIILTYSIIIIIGAIIYYISGLWSILNFFLSLSIYTLIFYFFHYLWVKLNKLLIIPFPEFMNYFLWRASLFILFIILAGGGLSYLSNETFPATMPEYTISNGTKVVKFQAMSHIGTEKFYNQVKENLKQFKKEGAVYFYEGVKPGTKENSEKFNQAIGIKFDKDLYKNFSKLYGVENQQNGNFLGLINNKDFNVDLNLDDIMDLYEKKNLKSTESKIPIDASKEIIKTLSQLNDKELKILVYINQAILNFIISNETTQNFLTEKFSNKGLFDVILGERNKVIANAIINSKYKKIYTTYGLLHFKGVLKLLKESDSNWEIVDTKYLYPIKD